MPASVLVVLMNYSRPQNMPRVIQAWRAQQGVDVELVVVDNSSALLENELMVDPTDVVGPVVVRQEAYPKLAFTGASDVWRFRENHGCPGRFAPALMKYGHSYTLFADDDLLPGSRALENAVAVAEGTLHGEFSTLGVCCRIFPASGYNPRMMPLRGELPVRCDLACRVHLTRAENVIHALLLRHDLLVLAPERAEFYKVHDDMLLSLGIQRATGSPSYAMPLEKDDAGKLIAVDLDDGVALWRKPGHMEARSQMVELAKRAGWKSLR